MREWRFMMMVMKLFVQWQWIEQRCLCDCIPLSIWLEMVYVTTSCNLSWWVMLHETCDFRWKENQTLCELSQDKMKETVAHEIAVPLVQIKVIYRRTFHFCSKNRNHILLFQCHTWFLELFCIWSSNKEIQKDNCVHLFI